MFTSVWRLIFLSCSFSICCVSLVSAELPDDCGKLLRGPNYGHTLYVFCPSLPELSDEQAHSLVVGVLDYTTRRAGDIRIFFFRDESILRRDSWPANQERLIESWGDALVGAYHTHTQLLTVRSENSDSWREMRLTTARE
jgi:hypothetical protein